MADTAGRWVVTAVNGRGRAWLVWKSCRTMRATRVMPLRQALAHGSYAGAMLEDWGKRNGSTVTPGGLGEATDSSTALHTPSHTRCARVLPDPDGQQSSHTTRNTHAS